MKLLHTKYCGSIIVLEITYHCNFGKDVKTKSKNEEKVLKTNVRMRTESIQSLTFPLERTNGH